MPSFTEERYDFPLATATGINYVVCSIPRSGSNFLATVLRSTGQGGFPIEYFHPNLLADFQRRAGVDDLAATIEFLKRRRTSPNGVFGFKAHFDQFVALAKAVDLDRTFPSLKYVNIIRRDVLGQAISFARALDSGSYTSLDKARGEVAYNDRLIELCFNEIMSLNASWQRYFAFRGLDVLDVIYEELAADPAAILGELSRFFGLSEPLSMVDREFVIEKQADAINESWRRQTYEAHRAKRFPQPDDQVYTLGFAPSRWILREFGARVVRRLTVGHPAR